MKVAIASDDSKTISSHFGRTKGFVVYDIEGDRMTFQEYRQNTFTGHGMGHNESEPGHNCHSSIINALKDCKAVISHGMGRRIYNDLRAAGIEVIVTDQTDVQSALNLFCKGNLKDYHELSCKHKNKCRD